MIEQQTSKPIVSRPSADESGNALPITSGSVSRWFLWIIFLVYVQVLGLAATPIPAAAEDISRQEIQAALIIKFTEFIQWPEDASNGNASPWFTLAVIGENEYEGLFEPFVDRLFQNKKLRILRYAKTPDLPDQDIENAQILIIGQAEKDSVDKLLSSLSEHPILTIGDFPGFVEQGGMINFYPKPGNRIGFEINMDANNLSTIKISSHLLRMARRISNK